jgi:hypothetical protein
MATDRPDLIRSGSIRLDPAPPRRPLTGERMTSPVQLVLTIVPLASYLYLLAIWQAGRYPRVIPGAFDVSLLALGVGGLALYGPFGQMLARILFGRPAPIHWWILTLAAILVVSTLARRSSRRLVIYHVDPEALESTLRDLFEPVRFFRTLNGYEDRTHARGVRVDVSPRWQSAVIEAYGRDPDALIQELEPTLRERLRAAPARTSDVGIMFFGLSALAMLVPLTGFLLDQPRARAVLRVLLEHLPGG